MKIIDHFDTVWLGFSNFAAAPFLYLGRLYPTAEHAYQAAKVADPVKSEEVANAKTPGLAKALGRRYKDRKDWDQVKVDVMTEIVRAKFQQHDDLAELLVSTGDSVLEEGNAWGDSFWGVYKGRGRNELGKILMKIRSELKGDICWPSVAAGLQYQISGFELGLLTVFEKIGEEIGEFNDEIIKGTSRENLEEEAVDLLVTSMAAVEACERATGLTDLDFSWRDTTKTNVDYGRTNVGSAFDIAKLNLAQFISAYGRLARSQRKWRKKLRENGGDDTTKLNMKNPLYWELRPASMDYLIASKNLATSAFELAEAIMPAYKVIRIYDNKVEKWATYSDRAAIQAGREKAVIDGSWTAKIKPGFTGKTRGCEKKDGKEKVPSQKAIFVGIERIGAPYLKNTYTYYLWDIGGFTYSWSSLTRYDGEGSKDSEWDIIGPWEE
jgi:ribA/ribD-fused uncharacterized protein